MINHLEINKEKFLKKYEEVKNRHLELVNEISEEEKRGEIEKVKFLYTKKFEVYFDKKRNVYLNVEKKEKTSNAAALVEVRVMRREKILPKSIREKLHNIQENKKYL